MDQRLLNILVDPATKRPLRLVDEDGGPALVAEDGTRFPVVAGIPRFVIDRDVGQSQTRDAFGYKWTEWEKVETEMGREEAARWLVSRYGFRDAAEMRDHFSQKRAILDAGCGSGFSASLWMEDLWKGDLWVGADISSAIDAASRRLGGREGLHFVQADLNQMPFADGTFDTIFSEGVLHHTPSTEETLHAIAPLLAPGGEIMFYVYRKKPPIREFTDDHLRQELGRLSKEEGMEVMAALTRFAESLAKQGVTIEVPEDIGLLGMKKGTYDLQRFIYWHIMKFFWNDHYSFKENTFVNFDWYSPTYAHRHTKDEILGWCEDLGLHITHMDEQESGYTVRAVKEA